MFLLSKTMSKFCGFATHLFDVLIFFISLSKFFALSFFRIVSPHCQSSSLKSLSELRVHTSFHILSIAAVKAGLNTLKIDS